MQETIRRWENGTVKMIRTYDEKGKLMLVLEYYETGVKRKLQRFKDGIPHGVCVLYRPNGNILFCQDFKDGKKVNI